MNKLTQTTICKNGFVKQESNTAYYINLIRKSHIEDNFYELFKQTCLIEFRCSNCDNELHERSYNYRILPSTYLLLIRLELYEEINKKTIRIKNKIKDLNVNNIIIPGIFLFK